MYAAFTDFFAAATTGRESDAIFDAYTKGRKCHLELMRALVADS